MFWDFEVVWGNVQCFKRDHLDEHWVFYPPNAMSECVGNIVFFVSVFVFRYFLRYFVWYQASPWWPAVLVWGGRRLKGGFWSLFYWAHLMGNKAASEGTMRQTPPPIVARSETSYLKQRWDIQPGSKLRYLTISRSRLRAAGPSRLQCAATNNKPGSKSLLDTVSFL